VLKKKGGWGLDLGVLGSWKAVQLEAVESDKWLEPARFEVVARPAELLPVA
jgi:hypothetical protein